MAQQTLNNLDPRGDFRQKLNEMFTELYTFLTGAVQSVTGDGVDNTDPSNPVVTANRFRVVTGNDSITQSDNLSLIIFNSAIPFNFTIDQLLVGSKFTWINYGAGTVTLVAGTGVTIDGNTTAPGRNGNNIAAGFVDYSLSATEPISTSGGASSPSGVTYWQTLPGTPTRTNTNSFTITDTGNANLYDLKFSRGTVLKWTDSGSTKMGMVISASYSSDAVTITILGDEITTGATMSSMQYAIEKADEIRFAIAGTIATGTNISFRYHAPMALKIFGGKAYHGTAGSTGSTTYDVNKNGTTMFTTKLSVSSGATVGSNTTVNDGTTIAADDMISVDCDSVSTTAPVDAYVKLFVFPLNNQYL